MKQIKRLTWKYFIDQKIKEIVGRGLFLSVILLFLYTLGRLDYLGVCGEYPNCSPFLIAILVGLTNLILVAVILAFVALSLLLLCYLLYELFGKWIKSNWKKAKKKAREELR